MQIVCWLERKAVDGVICQMSFDMTSINGALTWHSTDGMLTNDNRPRGRIKLKAMFLWIICRVGGGGSGARFCPGPQFPSGHRALKNCISFSAPFRKKKKSNFRRWWATPYEVALAPSVLTYCFRLRVRSAATHLVYTSNADCMVAWTLGGGTTNLRSIHGTLVKVFINKSIWRASSFNQWVIRIANVKKGAYTNI